jgi:hypothetical protein
MRRFITVTMAALALGAAAGYDSAQAGQQQVRRAIMDVFGPRYGPEAVRVARCESNLRTWASNGQYLGIFQMGRSERARYGHGRGAYAQARAAHRYFVASGRDWSPWQCRPSGGLAW